MNTLHPEVGCSPKFSQKHAHKLQILLKSEEENISFELREFNLAHRKEKDMNFRCKVLLSRDESPEEEMSQALFSYRYHSYSDSKAKGVRKDQEETKEERKEEKKKW